MRTTPSLRSCIRNGTLLMALLTVGVGAYLLPRVYQLGGAIRETLYRNYLTIEAAQHMHAALHRLQVAELEAQAGQTLPAVRHEFMHWMDIEKHNFTEVGEPQLARDIESRARRLFGEIAKGSPRLHHDSQFAELHILLDQLIRINQAAMFRADSRAVELGTHITYEFGAGLLGLLLAGAAIWWGLGHALLRPLTELAGRLRGVSQRKSGVRLGPQRFAELATVAREFNQMAERLEQYEKLNVGRLLYEKSKIEAIIEGLEDGIVLIDSEGSVTHINEVAEIILGVERSDALGSPFDDLSSNHPHYLRIRDALRTLQRSGAELRRIEVQLYMRGRDHSYVLKPVALQNNAGAQLGTLLVLQDVTYLRDQDRARTNLVATLSHELRTPLTSLALSAELLNRENGQLAPRQRELVTAIVEECSHMRQLADSLLNLARGGYASITLQQERLDLARLADEVCSRFAIQLDEKHITMKKRISRVPAVFGDSVKLSWVISNLIGNALRYTPQGGWIELRTCHTNRRVRLEVEDSGPGIAPELRRYIFERFIQCGDRTEQGSAGLGLAIAKDIVEAHGGRIFLENGSVGGCRFIVDLPVALEV